MEFKIHTYWRTAEGGAPEIRKCIVFHETEVQYVIVPEVGMMDVLAEKSLFVITNPSTNRKEYYDLTRIATIDERRLNRQSCGQLTTADSKRLSFVLRSLLAPRIGRNQCPFAGTIVSCNFENSTDALILNKFRPGLIVKMWANGKALVLPITSSEKKHKYRAILPIGKVGPLTKRSFVAIDQWYSVSLKDIKFHPDGQLPQLGTVLLQERCSYYWA
ncbi:hypothetical protein FUA23_09100 [Neolewinella aurantiaca]|uniref:Uncharacterized protein n=1 Tax=Neolewinella aurantiaca TaxID=2602767 RepID=A0A5C7FU69_9BACT|nr:hypothetical protein [Neolewinella aurantiaca]TXF89832.1 hypothetical protein FUA23_09100 [Neolewinella aurantiaca]